jgi:hypothetical protein
MAYYRRSRTYKSDDPYGPDAFPMPRRLVQDANYGAGKGQPAWLRPHECFDRSRGVLPGNLSVVNVHAEQLLKHGGYHLEKAGSERRVFCVQCSMVIPDDDERKRRRYSGDVCARAGDLANRRKKRAKQKRAQQI